MSKQNQIEVPNVVTPSTEKVSGVQHARTNVRVAINLATSAASATRREKYDNNKRSFGSPKAREMMIRSVQTQDALSSQSEEYSSEEDSFCLQ